MMTNPFNILFNTRPWQWGLRGDPHLWHEMQEKVADLPYPQSAAELVDTLHALFQQLTGAPITSDKFIFVERYNKGGMSSGLVSPQFWRETAVPHLLTTYEAIMELDTILQKLAKPAQRALHNANINTIDQLTALSAAELAALHGIGRNALSTITETLAANGRSLTNAPQKDA